MRLKSEHLLQKCSTENLSFANTEDINPFKEGIIGQERAVNAVSKELNNFVDKALDLKKDEE